MEWQLTVQSISPLALSANRANEQFAEGLDYIPGTTLRGALAARYLADNGPKPDESFEELFLGNRVSYPDLLPSPSETSTSAVFPATARACKRHRLTHPASLEDGLLQLAVQSEQLAAWDASPGPVPDGLLERRYCPTCQALGQRSPLYQLTGHYSLVPSAGYAVRRVRPYRRLITGTSINRATGTVEQGMLFSRDVLEEDQYFSGVVRLADEMGDALKERLAQLLRRESVLRVGYGRSRGLGKLRVARCEPISENGPDLAERWKRFNDRAHDLGLPDTGEYFSLSLESDWIRQGGPSGAPGGLPESEELGLPAAERHRCVVAPATIMGWNALQGLPKQSQRALKRGSVLLFKVPAGAAETARQRLAEIERDGLGERPDEGFGRLSVCHPFHYESLQVEVKHE
jgi:CRISPR-associated protein Csx10